jgi:hypothetical protein
MSMWRKSFCIPIIIDKLLGDINGKISKWSILFAFYYILCKHITYFAEVIKAKVKTHSDILWLIWRYKYKFEQEWTLPMHPVSSSIFSMGSCFSIFSFSVVLCRSLFVLQLGIVLSSLRLQITPMVSSNFLIKVIYIYTYNVAIQIAITGKLFFFFLFFLY